MASAEEKGVATLERALTILATFEASPTLPLAEISRRTGLYKSTLLRLLATLGKFGYVGQEANGNYHVGVAALYLGGLYQRWVKPAELINPVLTHLVAQTGESCSFNVRENGVRVCVYRVDSPQRIRDHVHIGDILPLNKGAVGKILTAFDVARDAPGWAALRTQCFSSTSREIESDTAAVATPVFSVNDQCAGALAVTGPASRFSAERIQEMRAPLLRAALELSRSLGGGTAPLEFALHHAQNHDNKFFAAAPPKEKVRGAPRAKSRPRGTATR